MTPASMLTLAHALEGVKVLDFSQGIAAPHAACLLAEMGAAVTKVEPPQGDWLRGLGVKRNGSSVMFGTFNRGKRGLALDLKQPEGKAAALRLIDQADVLLESNRAGVMARLGLDYETLRQRNPRLVYVSITGFGQTGPYVDRPATDAAVQAFTGFSFGAGDMVEPIRVRVSVVDVVTGIYASQGVLAALLQRARTGAGQHLDISLMHSITAVQAYKYAEHEATGGALRKEVFPGIGIFATADGYIAMSAMREQQVTDLIGLIGQAALLQEERFATPQARFANQDLLRGIISECLATQPTAHWLPRMQALDLICQEVLNYDAYRRDPQVLAHQLFTSADLGEAGELPAVRMPGLPAGGVPAPAPRIGEHTRALLAEAGFGEEELAGCLARGAAVAAP